MTVYVDDMLASFRGMIMSHMIADTHEELMAMARRLRLDPRWVQKAGTHYEHFDVSQPKKAQAVFNGAKLITQRELALRCMVKREPGHHGEARKCARCCLIAEQNRHRFHPDSDVGPWDDRARCVGTCARARA